MVSKARPANVSQPEGPCCAHHWLIESPAGQTSRGVCQKCGTSREFHDSLEATGYLRSEQSDWQALGEAR